jgi:glycosyltransferase involved in cell wall biosynthesis
VDLRQVTPLILTFDESANIGRTLNALAWADKILLVDSCSTDGTQEIARSVHPGVRIVERPFDSFAGQCNFGLTQVDTEWVLSLDADYLVTAELVQEISALPVTDDLAGYSIEFCYCIFGQPLRSSVYPQRTVLYRRRLANYRDEGHGHRVNVSGQIGKLAGKILHDDRKPLARWLSGQNKYAAREAEHLLTAPREQLNQADRVRRYGFIAPPAMFLYTLIGKGLIFDGFAGWFYCFQRTIAELILSLHLLARRAGVKETATQR